MLDRARRILIGAPKDIEDPHIFHKISLIAFLAWIGLGADGLSSSAYGPDEAFRSLGEHRELAIFLAIATTMTVFIISFAYSRIIEHFPTGGGGYVVASKLLGAPAGVVSGSALLIDYVLTITVSISSGADAIFDFIRPEWRFLKLPVEYGAILLLIVMNLRGVKESIKVLVPIFLLFLATHAIMLGSAFFQHYHEVPAMARTVASEVHSSYIKIGGWALFLIFARAYSMGAGTFTGIEAVSNGLAIMREPKVATGKRTMVYMAVSLAVTAGGILLAYQLLNVRVPTTPSSKTYAVKTSENENESASQLLRKVKPSDEIKKGQVLAEGGGWVLTADNDGEVIKADDSGIEVKYDPADKMRPLNAVLLDRLVEGSHFFGNWFVVLTLIAEALLLLIAAQTGFIDGPRVMANMALDSWLPHRFSSLSERLTMHNGVYLMGGASIAALWYTGGSVETLVTMYSINVFITFSLTELGMCKFYITERHKHKEWKHALPIHMTGLTLCVSILTVVVIEKFSKGAWVTLVVTGLLIAFCFMIRHYYQTAFRKLGLLSLDIQTPAGAQPAVPAAPLNNKLQTAVLLVGSYGPLGMHSFMEIRRLFQDQFTQIIFVSVAVVDSGSFKGADEIERLKEQTQLGLDKYVELARRFGMSATSMMNVGNEPVDGAEELCMEVALRYPRASFFAGKLVFQRERWYERYLHNETAFAIQRRLQWLGYPMVVLPVRVWKGGLSSARLPITSHEMA